MRKITITTVRYALSLLFLVFGANKLLHFKAVPMPAGDAGLYYALLFKHHIMAVTAIIEVSGGVLLLTNRFVPLGITLLGPVVINIILYHLFFDASHIAIGLLAAVLETALAVEYRRTFAILFAPASIP